jgi:hypothetical protein
VFFLLRWIVSESSLGLLLLIGFAANFSGSDNADPHGILYPPLVTLPKHGFRPVSCELPIFFLKCCDRFWLSRIRHPHADAHDQDYDDVFTNAQAALFGAVIGETQKADAATVIYKNYKS